MLAANERGDLVVRLTDERLTAYRDAREVAEVATPCAVGRAQLRMVGERTLVFDEEAGRLHFFGEGLRADGVAEVGRGGRLLAVGERHALFADAEGRTATLELHSRKLRLAGLGAGVRVAYACAQSGDLYYVGHGHRLDVWDLVDERVASTFRVVLEFVPAEMVAVWEGRYILFADEGHRELFRLSDWSRRPRLPAADRVRGSRASRYLALRTIATGSEPPGQPAGVRPSEGRDEWPSEWIVVEVSSGRECARLGHPADVWVLPSTTEPTLVLEEEDGTLRWLPPVRPKTDGAPREPAERRASRLFAATEVATTTSTAMTSASQDEPAPSHAPAAEAAAGEADEVAGKSAWREWAGRAAGVSALDTDQRAAGSADDLSAEGDPSSGSPTSGPELSRWRAQLFGLPVAVPPAAALGSVIARAPEDDRDPIAPPVAWMEDARAPHAEYEESWRDRLVLWSGLADTAAPVGGRLELAGARLGLDRESTRGLAFLYRRRLLGRPAPAPAQLAVAIGGARGWSEALGEGELARLGVLSRGRLRPRLSPAVVRFLDGGETEFEALAPSSGGRAIEAVERLVERFGARPPAEVALAIAARVSSPLAWFSSPPRHPHELAECALGARLHGRVALFIYRHQDREPARRFVDASPHPLLLVVDADPRE